jgi:hypothetical protein
MPGKFIYNPITKLDEENPDLAHLVEELNEQLSRITQAFDTLGMSYGYMRNVADTGSASSDFAVQHDLGVIPDGFLIMGVSIPCRIWTGDTAWGSTNVYLQCDKANVDVTVLCFVDTN